jgi:hypothetical protein
VARCFFTSKARPVTIFFTSPAGEHASARLARRLHPRGDPGARLGEVHLSCRRPGVLPQKVRSLTVGVARE